MPRLVIPFLVALAFASARPAAAALKAGDPAPLRGKVVVLEILQGL